MYLVVFWLMRIISTKEKRGFTLNKYISKQTSTLGFFLFILGVVLFTTYVFGGNPIIVLEYFTRFTLILSVGVYMYIIVKVFQKSREFIVSIVFMLLSTIIFFLAEVFFHSTVGNHSGEIERYFGTFFWIGKFIKIFAFLLYFERLHNKTKVKRLFYIAMSFQVGVFATTFLNIMNHSMPEFRYFMASSFNLLFTSLILLIVIGMKKEGFLHGSTIFLVLISESSLLFLYGLTMLGIRFEVIHTVSYLGEILYGISFFSLALATLEGELFRVAKNTKLNYSLLGSIIRQGYGVFVLLFLLIYSTFIDHKESMNYLLVTACFLMVVIRQFLLSFETKDYLLRYYRLRTNYDQELEVKTNELLIREQQSIALFGQMDEAILLLDKDIKTISYNQAFEDWFLSRDIFTLLARMDLEQLVEFEEKFEKALQLQKSEWGLKIKDIEDKEIIIEIKLIPLQVSDGPNLVYVLMKDITESIKNKLQIDYLAYHDKLTGLPNRLKFYQVLDKLLEDSRDSERNHFVMFFDVDKFKSINDMYGHEVGDKVLCEVANRGVLALQNKGIVCRNSGDEFVGIVWDTTKEKMKEIVISIIKEVAWPMHIGQDMIKTGVSIGISQYKKDGMTADELVNHADMAMYIVKENPTFNYHFYKKDENCRMVRRKEVEEALKEAVEKKEFVLHYQPVVDILRKEIIGAEALIRWHHPKLGLMYPLDFIPIAEEVGEIEKIQEWVFREVCRQLAEWNKTGVTLQNVSVNVSNHQLENLNFPKRLCNILKEYNITSDMLSLEISESIAASDEKVVIEIIKELSDCGFPISIDNFGVGYTALSFLSKYHLTGLKIDKYFIQEIKFDTAMQNKMLDIIIHMADQLDLSIIAEGVETQEQMRYLIEKQCNVMQGYYFSHPVSSQEVCELIRKERNLDGESKL